jgi:hypothetical protein
VNATILTTAAGRQPRNSGEDFVGIRFPYPMVIHAGIVVSTAFTVSVSLSIAAGTLPPLATSLTAGVIMLSYLVFRDMR